MIAGRPAWSRLEERAQPVPWRPRPPDGSGRVTEPSRRAGDGTTWIAQIASKYSDVPTRVRLDVCILLVDFPPAFGAAPCGTCSARSLVRSSVASQPPRSSERHGRAGHPTCGLGSWSVNYRVRRSLSRACCQCGTGGSRDLALGFSIWAITSSRLAHPCRYRQSISKVRSVGLPPVHRWINKQAMIAQ